MNSDTCKPVRLCSTCRKLLNRLDSGSNDSTKNWVKLQETERKRRALLKRTDESSYRILFSYEGTFWVILVRSALLWITVAVYILARLLAPLDRWSLPPVEASHVGIVGTLITFFLVYFHIQYSNRFDQLFMQCMACQGRIFDLSLLAKTTLTLERATRLICYLNAAHIVAFAGVSPQVYSIDDVFYHLNEKWQLLTPEELARLRDIGMLDGSAMYREALTWCMMEVHDAHKCGLIGEYSSVLFQEKILSFRGAFATIYDLDDQPILFYYIHFIHFLSAVYLPLLAFFVANQVTSYGHWTGDVIGLVVVVLQGIFVIGIRVFAQMMQRPFGGELENLSVLTYLKFVYEGSMRVLKSEIWAPLDVDLEKQHCETCLSRTTTLPATFMTSKIEEALAIDMSARVFRRRCSS